MADSTWKTYKTAVESFQSFRKLYNLQDTCPAPLYDLLFYIAYMSHTGLSASTITTYISGISTMHILNGHTDNTKSFLVTKILEGSKADLRLPVSMNLLKRLIQSLPFVCTSVYESTTVHSRTYCGGSPSETDCLSCLTWSLQVFVDCTPVV